MIKWKLVLVEVMQIQKSTVLVLQDGVLIDTGDAVLFL